MSLEDASCGAPQGRPGVPTRCERPPRPRSGSGQCQLHGPASSHVPASSPSEAARGGIVTHAGAPQACPASARPLESGTGGGPLRPLKGPALPRPVEPWRLGEGMPFPTHSLPAGAGEWEGLAGRGERGRPLICAGGKATSAEGAGTAARVPEGRRARQLRRGSGTLPGVHHGQRLLEAPSQQAQRQGNRVRQRQPGHAGRPS